MEKYLENEMKGKSQRSEQTTVVLFTFLLVFVAIVADTEGWLLSWDVMLLLILLMLLMLIVVIMISCTSLVIDIWLVGFFISCTIGTTATTCLWGRYWLRWVIVVKPMWDNPSQIASQCSCCHSNGSVECVFNLENSH